METKTREKPKFLSKVGLDSCIGMIKQYLRAYEMSQAKFSELVGIDPTTLSLILRNAITPNPETIMSIGVGLKLNPYNFLAIACGFETQTFPTASFQNFDPCGEINEQNTAA